MLVDGDDASLQERLVRPMPSNMAAMQNYDFYPAEARNRGIQGTVVYVAIVEADGKISQYARIESSGSDLLDKAAVGYFSKVRFNAGKLDGAPVRMLLTMPVTFNLPGHR